MRARRARGAHRIGALALAVGLFAATATTPTTPSGPPSAPSQVESLRGGMAGFYCMAGMAMMWGGLFTLQPEIALVGSIAMGIGCGTGN
ncbi:MAG: hypothetical protein KC591_12490 [Gemmatimonadetes bacterium]|nr:hypothetical protein [Gemmatimonadota bacterium]